MLPGKKYTLTVLLCMLLVTVRAHNADERILLSTYRDSIAITADSTINATTEMGRLSASYQLIGLLKRTIRTPGSYNFSLDSIPGLIQIRQEDNQFRIITWQIQRDDETYRHFGVIQLRSDTANFIPLVDYSDMYKRPDLAVVTPDRWLGMAYYGIKTVQAGKHTFYTLFGYDGNNALSTKKYIDIMWWDKDTLKFGAPLFSIPGMPTPPNRFVLEYNKSASSSLNYNSEEGMIMYDHLTLLGGEDAPYNYVPDGTYEGFAWEKGMWRQVDMIEYQKLEDGQAPSADPNKKASDILYQRAE